MSVLATPAVDLHTCPQDVPSVPAWFPEVVILARRFTQRGLLDALSTEVHVARGRAGLYEVIDFVAVLLGYAASGEATLEAFFDRLAPFAHPFMSLFGRARLPHRSTLSRFLADVDAAGLAALRHLFQADLAQHGFAGPQIGGFVDQQGHRLLVFDVDGTRQAARQRALAANADLPAPKRRLEAVCAPGYTGRKRGEVVRTRTTILQAHTQEWLGTFSGAGNGDYAGELAAACQVITAYLAARGLEPSQALVRLDGLYGTTAVVAQMQPYKLGFLMRGRDYHLLDHPSVQARLQHPCDLEVTHPETQVRREVFDIGYLADWLEERPDQVLSYRVILTRRPAPADGGPISVGKRCGAYVYELFLTSQPAPALPAATILDLYQQRGAFEQVLSDEDHEQDPDRWCSRTRLGQEFWQIVSQWVWNIRLELGSVALAPSLRWTTWEPAPAEVPVAAAPQPEPALATQAPVAGELVATYGPLELAQPWAKARRRFSAQDFALQADDTLTCPAGKVLRPRERRKLDMGDLRVLYAAKAHDCRVCPLAPQCLGRGASGAHPRRVSGVRRLVGWQRPPAPIGAPLARQAQVEEGRDDLMQRALQWCDVGGRRLRRELVALLRRQRVTITEPSASPPRPLCEEESRLWTRAERAHRRLSWASRLARNAQATDAPRYTVIVWGIVPPLAAYLSLPSTPAP
jgi:hypothetical protein